MREERSQAFFSDRSGQASHMQFFLIGVRVSPFLLPTRIRYLHAELHAGFQLVTMQFESGFGSGLLVHQYTLYLGSDLPTEVANWM